MLARLKDALARGLPLVEEMPQKQVQNLAGAEFSPGAHWVELPCEGEYVSEIIPQGFRAPTVPQGEHHAVRKRNYNQQFDRMVFCGMTELPKRYANNRIDRTKKDWEVIFERKTHSTTEVKLDL